jgi:2-methylisocitrate lyase-like PEP mutase family enzyme
VNVLARPKLTLDEIAAAGARRVSVGGSLAWVAVRAAKEAAARIADGDLSALSAD